MVKCVGPTRCLMRPCMRLKPCGLYCKIMLHHVSPVPRRETKADQSAPRNAFVVVADHGFPDFTAYKQLDNGSTYRPKVTTEPAVRNTLPVKHNHRRAALMIESARNRLWNLLTSARGNGERLSPAFRSCCLNIACAAPLHSLSTAAVTSIPSPSLFHSRLKTFLFWKSFLPQPSFSSTGLTPRITVTSEHSPFLVFSFFLFSTF